MAADSRFVTLADVGSFGRVPSRTGGSVWHPTEANVRFATFEYNGWFPRASGEIESNILLASGKEQPRSCFIF